MLRSLGSSTDTKSSNATFSRLYTPIASYFSIGSKKAKMTKMTTKSWTIIGAVGNLIQVILKLATLLILAFVTITIFSLEISWVAVIFTAIYKYVV